MFIEKTWWILLQRSMTLMFQWLQSVGFSNVKEYHEKRSVFASLNSCFLLLILVAKNSQRTVCLTTIWLVYTTGRLELRATHIHRWTAVHERTLERKYGWSEVNTPARMVHSITRSPKWTILPLYTYDGFIDWEIIHGSYNADLFVSFVERHVIPHTTPFPGPRSVLIMDNCGIHGDEVLRLS